MHRQICCKTPVLRATTPPGYPNTARRKWRPTGRRGGSRTAITSLFGHNRNTNRPNANFSLRALSTGNGHNNISHSTNRITPECTSKFSASHRDKLTAFSIWTQVWSSTEPTGDTSVGPANPRLHIGIDRPVQRGPVQSAVHRQPLSGQARYR